MSEHEPFNGLKIPGIEQSPLNQEQVRHAKKPEKGNKVKRGVGRGEESWEEKERREEIEKSGLEFKGIKGKRRKTQKDQSLEKVLSGLEFEPVERERLKTLAIKLRISGKRTHDLPNAAIKELVDEQIRKNAKDLGFSEPDYRNYLNKIDIVPAAETKKVYSTSAQTKQPFHPVVNSADIKNVPISDLPEVITKEVI
jgi:hypothetical protein